MYASIYVRLENIHVTLLYLSYIFHYSKTRIVRDWSKSIEVGGPEHLEMWLIKNTWLTPSLRHKND